MYEVTLEDITSGVIDGTGSFDKLMAIAKLHLLEEYKSQRITGDKYAEAYIQIMQAVMQTATQFTLQSNTASLNNELIAQKVKTEKAQIEDVVEGNNVAGVIGKTKEVQTAQAKGFTVDMLVKNAKMRSEVTNVLLSTGVSDTIPVEFSDAGVDAAVRLVGKEVGQPDTPKPPSP